MESGMVVAALVTVALTASACSSSDSSDDAGDDGSASATPATATAEPTRCIPVASALLEDLASGVEIAGGGSVRATMAVRSNDYEQVYFIAAELQGAGLDGDDDIAIWATDRNPDGSDNGPIFAVDGMANQFSSWPDGRASSASLSRNDDGALEARDCVRDVLR